MPVDIIDLLEVVEVQENQAERAVAVQPQAKRREQVLARGDPGQRSADSRSCSASTAAWKSSVWTSL